MHHPLDGYLHAGGQIFSRRMYYVSCCRPVPCSRRPSLYDAGERIFFQCARDMYPAVVRYLDAVDRTFLLGAGTMYHTVVSYLHAGDRFFFQATGSVFPANVTCTLLSSRNFIQMAGCFPGAHIIYLSSGALLQAAVYV
jgi:hypothetical protein